MRWNNQKRQHLAVHNVWTQRVLSQLGLKGKGSYSDLADIPIGIVGWFTSLGSQRLVALLDASIEFDTHGVNGGKERTQVVAKRVLADTISNTQVWELDVALNFRITAEDTPFVR